MHKTKVYTIGHGNRAFNDFVNLLNTNSIKILVDVRTYPFSRFNPDFRKVTLQTKLESVGIKYVFLGEELGGKPKSQEYYFEGVLSYERLERSVLYNKGISELLQFAKSAPTCIMCSESKPEGCHRKELVASTLSKLGIAVSHINEKGVIVENF